MNYKTAYEYGMQILEKAQVPESALDARLLLEEICGTNRTTLFAHPDKELSEEEYKQYEAWIARRAERIPLQHILGKTEFMGLTFAVNVNVLCPRPDTEVLVEEAMKYLHDGMRILDMCTGSGCILLSLLHYSNDCCGVGVDLSPEALQVAKANCEKLGLEEAASFVESNLFEHVEGKFEIIVSNPPYIKTEEINSLMPEVRDHEPCMALDGLGDGLHFYRLITEQAKDYLPGGGMLFFEIGYDQGKDVQQIMIENGYQEVQVVKDFAGLDRVVYGVKI